MRDEIWLGQQVHLLNESGVLTPVDPNCLLFFIDETGNEAFVDPKYPVFGLGGCAILAKDYGNCLHAPWHELKSKHFNGARAPLHATNLRNPTPSQLAELEQFFRAGVFFRLATLLSDKTTLSDGLIPYQIAALSFRERIKEVANRTSCSDLALIFEDSERTNRLIVRHFHDLRAQRVDNSLSTPIPLKQYFMPKSSCEPGLEVADFILHAAGTYARACAGKTQLPTCRRDFKATFQAVDQRLVSFFEITDVRKNPQPSDTG